MIVTCERCAARYKLDDSKIKGRGARFTCPECQHVFVVYTKGNEPEPGQEPSQAAEEDTQDDVDGSSNPLAQDADSSSGLVGTVKRADQLDYRRVGISTWKVRVKIGLVYDFSDIGTLRKYIQDRRVTEDDVISHDGSNWVRIGDIPDLDAYFVQVYEELEDQLQERGEEGEEEEFEDGPIMVVGMGSLRNNISTGVFERPGHKAVDASPSSKPLPGPTQPAPDPQRFVDPFESLKQRQRERMRARRKAEAQGRKPGSGKGAKGSDSSRRNFWLMAAGTVGVAAVLWYAFGRAPPTPAQVGTQPGSQVGLEENPGSVSNPEFDREEILRQIELQLQPDDEQPPDPIGTEDDPEENIYRALTPELKAKYCREGRLEGPACETSQDQGSQQGSVQSVQPTGGISQAATTAEDHSRAGAQAAAQRNWPTALTAYGKALSMKPGSARYLKGHAEALYWTGDLDKALNEFNTLLGYGDKSAHLYLGRILAQRGDDAGAVDHYRQYLAASPNDSGAQQELNQLLGQ